MEKAGISLRIGENNRKLVVRDRFNGASNKNVMCVENDMMLLIFHKWYLRRLCKQLISYEQSQLLVQE